MRHMTVISGVNVLFYTTQNRVSGNDIVMIQRIN